MCFIHRGQLYQRVEEGTAPSELLKAVGAVSARFLHGTESGRGTPDPDPDGGEFAARWSKEVKMEIAADLDRFSTHKLAALLCLIHHDYCSGRQASAWNLTALATRMAIGMDLHVESADQSALAWVDRETRRRLVWATFCADTASAGGLRECTTYGMGMVMNKSLPCSETEYAFGTPSAQQPTLESLLNGVNTCDSSLGISAHHILLVSLGYQVHRYLRLISTYAVKPWDPNSLFHQLKAKLRRWRDNLTPSMQLNLGTLYARKGNPEFGAFVHLHLLHEHILIILHRFVMPDFEGIASSQLVNEGPKDWTDHVSRECYAHARALGRKMAVVVERFPDFTPADWTWNIFVFCAVRHELVYLALNGGTNGEGIMGHPSDQGLHQSTAKGFEIMVGVMCKMTKYFDLNYKVVRDLVRILTRQGYPVSSDLLAMTGRWSSPSAGRTPARGPVFSKMPYLRRYLRYPQLDEAVDTPSSTRADTLVSSSLRFADSPAVAPASGPLFDTTFPPPVAIEDVFDDPFEMHDFPMPEPAPAPYTSDFDHIFSSSSAVASNQLTTFDDSVDWHRAPFDFSGSSSFSLFDLQTLDALFQPGNDRE